MNHGTVSGTIIPPRGQFTVTGRFGRMFPTLPPQQMTDAQIATLSAGMFGSGPAHPDLPAGYTYFGQFVDHDITFDTTSMPEVAIDPQQIHNFRTAKLELDSLYGLGPSNQPYLYTRGTSEFVLGTNSPGKADPSVPIGQHDLPRAASGIAIIGDPRNDENLAVSQLHLAFLRFHNEVVAMHRTGGLTGARLFEAARRDVIWHYQWTVLEDFLPRVIDKVVLADVRANGRRFYNFDTDAFIPVEFSVAAYRMGHSLIRDGYDWNRVFGFPAPKIPATLNLLFQFTGKSGASVPVPADWPVDWSVFFDLPSAPTSQRANRLDATLATTLGNIPIQVGNLASLNLTRGLRHGLPSGQSVAAAMGISVLTAAELTSGTDGAALLAAGLVSDTPLWFYILKEADVRGQGRRLGPVGSRIVAEVFVGLLQGDPESYLSMDPAWTPTLPKADPTSTAPWGMSDLITFQKVTNPV